MKQSLALDLLADGKQLSNVDVDELHMRVVQTLRRLVSGKSIARLDYRLLSRPKGHRLVEVRWEFEFDGSPLWLRLFLVEQGTAGAWLGIRFYKKALRNTLLETNQAQDLAIDDAIWIFKSSTASRKIIEIHERGR